MSFCLADEALTPGFDCYYTDLSPVVNGPPDDACPGAVSERYPFCGSGCGHCPEYDGSGPPVGCVGLSDDRGVGLCVWHESCSQASSNVGLNGDWELRGEPEPTACLVVRDPISDDWWDWGWLVGETPCRAYRDLYPDRFDCRGAGWESIP